MEFRPISKGKDLADPTSAEEDLKLLAECQEGRPEAFERLYEKYRERLYALVYRMVGHKEDALDIVQEVFIKVFQSLDKFEGRSSFYTWLCRIAMNKAIDHSRRRRRSASYEELTRDEEGHVQEWEGNFSLPSDPLEREEFRKALQTALEELPEIHRSVFVLYTWEGLAYREIAEVLQCSLGTVMSRLHYARKKLQKQLKQWQLTADKQKEDQES